MPLSSLMYPFCAEKGHLTPTNQMPLGIKVGLSSGDFVLMGTKLTPFQKGGGAPQFSAQVYCGQTAVCIRIPLGVEVGLGPGDFVFDVDPAPPRKKGSVQVRRRAF